MSISILNSTNVNVGTIVNEGEIIAGIGDVNRDFNTPSLTPKASKTDVSKKVFIVHGHDDEMINAVESVLKRWGLLPIILREEADNAMTIIEKFEKESTVSYAVVLMSDKDDIGGAHGAYDLKPRTRQNVIFELGYFMGKIGRNNISIIKRGLVELPSDIYGIVTKPFDDSNQWTEQLRKDLASIIRAQGKGEFVICKS